MGDNGRLHTIAFVALVNPIVVITGLATGLVVRRWWQVALGVVTAPAGYWIYLAVFGTIDLSAVLIPFLALAGVIWTSAAFGLKKASTS